VIAVCVYLRAAQLVRIAAADLGGRLGCVALWLLRYRIAFHYGYHHDSRPVSNYTRRWRAQYYAKKYDWRD
jgi:hypothetical protein